MATLSERVFVCVSLLTSMVLGSTTQIIGAPSAASLGPEVALAEPTGGYVGRLEVTPMHGPSGTRVTVTAQQLPPNQEFQLVWRTVKGSWRVENAEYHGREYKPVAFEIARAKSDVGGRLVAE